MNIVLRKAGINQKNGIYERSYTGYCLRTMMIDNDVANIDRYGDIYDINYGWLYGDSFKSYMQKICLCFEL